jgi:CDP-diacylglycerol--glycerol-3-phosphate 3-phosphatidyltransferase
MRHPSKQEAEKPARKITLTDWARARAAVLLNPVAHLLARLGVQPNAVTLLGFILQIGVGALFLLGRLRLGGVLLLVAAPLDALDGAVARVTDSDGLFGAFLDSTLDRLSDVALILGLAGYQFKQGALPEAALLLVALVFALMVSYARARAESLGADCKVGLMTRLERVLLIALLSAFRLTTVLAWTLAVLSVVTFLQRVVHVYLACSRRQ